MMHISLALIWDLLRLASELAIGVLVGVLIERWGWTAWLGKVTAPVLRIGHVPPELATSFCAAFASGAAAAGTLSRFRDAKTLSEKQVILGVMLNTFPTQLRHLPSQWFPLALLTSTKVAAAVFGVQIATGIARTFLYLFAGRKLHANQHLAQESETNAGDINTNENTATLQAEEKTQADETLTPEIEKRAENAERDSTEITDVTSKKNTQHHHASKSVWSEFFQSFRRIAVITLPLCAVIMILTRLGALDGLKDWLSGSPLLSKIGPHAPEVIAGSFASMMTAAGTAGDLMKNSLLDERGAALLLLAGSILSTPIRVLRHGGASYVGVLGLKRGTVVVTVAQTLRILSMIIATLLLAFFWRAAG